MYQKILVPLDGSKLAETALPYAETLASGCRTEELILVSVTERVVGRTSAPEMKEVYQSSDRPDVSGIAGGMGLAGRHLIEPDVWAGAKTTGHLSGKMESEIYYARDQFEIAGEEAGRGIKLTLGKMKEQAEKYLAKIAEAETAKGLKVRTEVLIGKPAEEIARYTEQEAIDTIVMSSHGRSGPSRLVWGSVTDQVLRSVCVPVVIVRAPGCGLTFEEKSKRPKKK
jgi:nucleotide-binding universal stress UspA family protein